MSATVAIGRFHDRAQAEMAAELLEQAAIPSVIQSPEGMWMGPLPQGATLLVRADQAQQARTLLLDAGLIS
jgi:hypothetical protein